MRYVIIGNGAAGVAAAAAIRKSDLGGEITILSAEDYAVYSKCLLPDFLSGEVAEKRLYIKDADFYEKHEIKVLYNHTATGVDTSAKRVEVNTGRGTASIPYDKLLIASGSKQFCPPIPGLRESNTHFLGTLSDAKGILDAARKARSVLVIGAGFVGLEAACSLSRLGKEVTVVEAQSDIVGGKLDPKVSAILQAGIRELGVKIVLGKIVSKISNFVFLRQTGTLSDGEKVRADMILVAAGSKPNLDFLAGAGIQTQRGVPVNDFMQTNVPDVYAAGDVVESIDAVTGALSLSPIWPNAVVQGEVAGLNMAGAEKKFSAEISSQNASEFRDIPLITMGMASATGPEYEEYVDDRPHDGAYRKLVVRDDRIVGMTFLGDLHNAGVIASLMKKRTDVSSVKRNMLSPSFGYSEVAGLLNG